VGRGLKGKRFESVLKREKANYFNCSKEARPFLGKKDKPPRR
jgi:hypothetical protein